MIPETAWVDKYLVYRTAAELGNGKQYVPTSNVIMINIRCYSTRKSS